METVEYYGCRYSDGGDSTLGLLMHKGQLCGYTIEDEHRKIKVSGETRIDADRYEIKFREEPLSKMNLQYQKAYSWFTWHLHLQNVRNFKWIYMHEGVTDDDTDGCIVVGDTANNNVVKAGRLGRSSIAYKRNYLNISAHLNAGRRVFITMVDENDLLCMLGSF